jgi:hypothetical protein
MRDRSLLRRRHLPPARFCYRTFPGFRLCPAAGSRDFSGHRLMSNSALARSFRPAVRNPHARTLAARGYLRQGRQCDHGQDGDGASEVECHGGFPRFYADVELRNRGSVLDPIAHQSRSTELFQARLGPYAPAPYLCLTDGDRPECEPRRRADVLVRRASSET